MNIDNLTDA